MDLKAVDQRIKATREAKNLTQEELAALVNLSTAHVSVIERGLKVTKLDTFVAIANASDVSADSLLMRIDSCIYLINSNKGATVISLAEDCGTLYMQSPYGCSSTLLYHFLIQNLQ